MRWVLVLALVLVSAAAAAVDLRVLTDEDAERYRRLFALEAQDRWSEADAVIPSLRDGILLGHVRFERYWRSRKYRTPYDELAAWLDEYGDEHPEAHKLYFLALKRRPASAAPPARPRIPARIPPATPSYETIPIPDPASAEGRRIAGRIAKLLRKGLPERAERIFRSKGTETALGDGAADKHRADIAFALYLTGRNASAYRLAKERAAQATGWVSLLHWVAGLSAYRLGLYEAAGRHFAGHAVSPAASPWNKSAGAFWAARVHELLERPREAAKWLDEAAKHRRTFYGMLAREKLGRPHDLIFDPPSIVDADILLVRRVPAAMRAAALAQLGRMVDAETEMRTAILDAGPWLETRSLLAVSERLPLPHAALRAGLRLWGEGYSAHDAALYPRIPAAWIPDGGCGVDQAVALGVARRESGFDSRAGSRKGARGLMQLLPSTAEQLAKQRRIAGKALEYLYDPRTNLTLGCDYLRHLLGRKDVGNDLLRAVIAYNAGLKNLRRWLRTIRDSDDPLLFVESLPFKETRIFVERVLANIWAYRARFEQGRPSLAGLTAGGSAVYRALDPPGTGLAQHARTR